MVIMSATVRITCTQSAPKGLDWVNEINKGSQCPTVLLDGQTKELRWDTATEIAVEPDKPHSLQVYVSVYGLHWCATQIETVTLAEGETRNFEYHLEWSDRLANRGQLNLV